MSRFGAKKGRKLPGAEFSWETDGNGEPDTAPTPLFPVWRSIFFPFYRRGGLSSLSSRVMLTQCALEILRTPRAAVERARTAPSRLLPGPARALPRWTLLLDLGLGVYGGEEGECGAGEL